MKTTRKTLKRIGILTGFGLAAFCVPASGANLLLNPSFESGGGEGGAPDNWSLITNSYGQHGLGGIGPLDGSFVLHAGSGYGDGGRYQDVTVVGGQAYRLTAYARAFDSDPDSGLIQVGTPGSNDTSLLDNNNAEYVNATVTDIPLSSWMLYSYDFTPAASGALRVSFQNISEGGTSAANFDSVSLDAIPEPSTVGLFALGALGLLGRRRR